MNNKMIYEWELSRAKNLYYILTMIIRRTNNPLEVWVQYMVLIILLCEYSTWSSLFYYDPKFPNVWLSTKKLVDVNQTRESYV